MNAKPRVIPRMIHIRLFVFWLILCLAAVSLLSGCRGLAQSAPTGQPGEAYPVRLSNARRSAEFSPSGVQFTPARGPLWRWQLISVGAANSALPDVETGEVAPINVAPGLVVYRRGLLDEQYLERPTSIEQQFILNQPLALGGADLVISGRVSSAGEFEAVPEGWLWRDENGVVSLGQVTAYDARGKQIPAEMEVSLDEIRLQVDGIALAAASYPVTIDPEIGSNDFRLTHSGPDADVEYDAFDPAIAYNSTSDEYLVVWAGDTDVTGDGQMQIFGQRISAADGSLLGSAFQVSASGYTRTPAVAFDSVSNQYLVVWSRGSSSPVTAYEIYGQRVNATGVLAGSEFIVSTIASALFPDIAYNSTDGQYLVVWAGNRNSSGSPEEYEIFGQRVDSSGTLLGSNVRVSDMGPDDNDAYQAQQPAVAYNSTSNQYLVVWSGDDDTAPLVEGEAEIFGQRLDSVAAELGSDFRISDMGTDGSTLYGAFRADVTYNPTQAEFLVVWMGEDDASPLVDDEFEIFGQRLNASGAEVGQHNFRISAMGPDGNTGYAAYRPRLAFNASDDRYMVVWRGDNSADGQLEDEYEIFQQMIYGDYLLGDKFREATRLSNMGGVGNQTYLADKPVVAYSSAQNDYLVAWQGEDNIGGLVDGEVEIFGQRYTNAPARCFVESTGDNITDYSGSTASVLQQAVDAASLGDTLKVAGDCTGVQNTDGITGTVYIDKSLSLQGGYVAPDITAANWLAASDAASYPTTLDAQGIGGVVYITNTAATVTIANLTITGGDVAGNGGGIWSDANSLALTGLSIENNMATGHGGGLFLADGGVTIANSTFDANTAEISGGGLSNPGSNVTITNSTFSGNQAFTNGGGLENSGVLTLTHVTLADNTADSDLDASGSGGAVYNISGALTIANSILAGNHTGANLLAASANCSGSGLTDAGYNLVGSSTGCPTTSGTTVQISNDTVMSAELAALRSNGGDTQTHALLSGSLAIDLIPAAVCSQGVDQRGEPRNDWACDSGAFEVQLSDSDTISKPVSTGIALTFGPTLAKIVVEDAGDCLTNLTVQRVESAAPNGTSNIGSERYWVITPTGCENGFELKLTLPTDNVPNVEDKLCRWDSASSHWECGQTADHSATAGPAAMPYAIARDNVLHLSTWAVGIEVTPTDIALLSLAGRSAGMPLIWLILFLLGLAALAGLVWFRHRRATR